jgi:hypothetical protein
MEEEKRYTDFEQDDAPAHTAENSVQALQSVFDE